MFIHSNLIVVLVSLEQKDGKLNLKRKLSRQIENTISDKHLPEIKKRSSLIINKRINE